MNSTVLRNSCAYEQYLEFPGIRFNSYNLDSWLEKEFFSWEEKLGGGKKVGIIIATSVARDPVSFVPDGGVNENLRR